MAVWLTGLTGPSFANIRSLVEYSPPTLLFLYPSRIQRLVPQLLPPPPLLPSNSSETRPMVGAAPRIFKPWGPHAVADPSAQSCSTPLSSGGD